MSVIVTGTAPPSHYTGWHGAETSTRHLLHEHRHGLGIRPIDRDYQLLIARGDIRGHRHIHLVQTHAVGGQSAEDKSRGDASYGHGWGGGGLRQRLTRTG